jgi:hypothetical protein
MMLRSGTHLSLALLIPLSLGACHDSTPTPPTTLAPAPSATPIPTPAPTPTPEPVGTCDLAPMPDCGATGCCKESNEGLFDDEIRAAQDALRESKPEWFKENGSLKVDEITYTAGLAKKITEMFGLCTRGGDLRNPPAGGHSISGDEVGIKRDNGRSQNVDVILGASNKPSITGYFTCKPASF